MPPCGLSWWRVSSGQDHGPRHTLYPSPLLHRPNLHQTHHLPSMRIVHETHRIVVSVVKMQESPFETVVARDDGATLGKSPSSAVPTDHLGNVCLRSVLSPLSVGPTRTQPLARERPAFSFAEVDTWLLVSVALLAVAMGVSMFSSRRCRQSADAFTRPLGVQGWSGKTDSPAQCRLRAFRGPMARIPGPWYTAWTSLVHTFHTLRGRGPVYVHSLHMKYGTCRRWLHELSPRRVLFAGCSSVNQVPWCELVLARSM